MSSVYLALSGRSLSWGRGLVTSVDTGLISPSAQDDRHRTFRQQAEQGFTYLSLSNRFRDPLPDIRWNPFTVDLLDWDWFRNSYPCDPGSGVHLPMSWVPRLRSSDALRDPGSTTLKLFTVAVREEHL